MDSNRRYPPIVLSVQFFLAVSAICSTLLLLYWLFLTSLAGRIQTKPNPIEPKPRSIRWVGR